MPVEVCAMKDCLRSLIVVICWIAIGIPAMAQHFKQITGSLTQIAVGRAEVWGLNGSKVYRFDSSKESFNEVSGSLAHIAVGGGTLLQKDEVWGVSASGTVYRFNFSKNSLSKVSGDLVQIVVGEGDYENCHPYEVWGLDAGRTAWRYNYCKSKFEESDLPPMTSIAVGASGVWGVDESGMLIQVDGTGYGSGSNLGNWQQIAVGVNDVWGIDSSSEIYRRGDGLNDYTNICASSTGGSCLARQVAAGGDGVWIAYNYLQGGLPLAGIGRFTFSTANGSGSNEFFTNEFSVEALHQSVVQIAVGSGGGVWAITSSRGKTSVTYQVCAFVRP
jgi:Tectonin domain